MLGRSEAIDYFPDLGLQKGRIVKIEEGKAIPLETEDSTSPLMR